jgi:hypothetical protein
MKKNWRVIDCRKKKIAPKEEEINGVANSWLFLKTGGLS